MMKPAKDWVSESPALNDLLVGQIQKDALLHAADLCKTQFSPRPGEDRASTDGVVNLGIENCENAILEAAEAIKTEAVTC